ncbi:hypothetical protein [uncultured Cyclobacterium sp.]|uniref:hypothetical protein n=1 Tax=uncultured Cyclobacterium sp. TaxID=453820 RepID=UPI0030EC556E|tara:strand:- start:2945 stop:4498 length:1554 start_codon:yes stop_codon:yes gene_type:complete
MKKSYLKIIKECPLLEKYKDEENFEYIPLFKLANKLEEKVSSLMKNNSKTFIENGFDKSYNNLSPYGEGDKNYKNRTIFIIEYQLNIDYKKKDDSNKNISNFWKGAKRGKSSNNNFTSSYQPPSLDFLNLISRAVGYKSFENFCNQYFYTSETIKILILPFFEPTSKSTFVQNLLSYEFNLFQKEELLSLDIIKLVSKNPKEHNNFNWINAKKIGNKQHGDLVIWGRLDQDNTIHTSFYALKPEISFFWKSNPLDLRTFTIKNIKSEFLEKFQKSLLWSTAIRLSLKKEYRKSINIFRKLLNDNYQPLETNLCLAVVYQLKKYPKYVDHHVIAAVATAMGVSLKKAKDSMNKIHSLDKLEGSIIDHFTKDWKYLKIEKKPDEKTQIWKLSGIIYYEFVAAIILLGYKKIFTPANFEKILQKISEKVENSWFKSIYAEVFATVYFEMGKLKEEKLLRSPEIGPEDIYELYKIAILCSTDKNIHDNCIAFFIKYEQFEKIKNAVNNSEIKSKAIKSLYA